MCIYCHFDIISVTNAPLEPRLRQSAFTRSIINCKLLTSYIIHRVMDETVVTVPLFLSVEEKASSAIVVNKVIFVNVIANSLAISV